jgi:PAS domain S-box-containing protein
MNNLLAEQIEIFIAALFLLLGFYIILRLYIIAPLREANRKFKETNDFSLEIVKNSLLAIITIKETGEIRAVNPAAENLFGFVHNDVLDCDMGDLIIPARYREAHRKGLQRYRRERHSRLVGQRLELFALRSDGSEFPIEMTMSVAIFNGVHYFTAFISDLTEAHKARDELARQREALRQSEKLSAMGALLAGVAHELNNPLAILIGRATLLENKIQGEGKTAAPLIAEDIKRIKTAAERCGRIVRTFLSMAKQKPANRQSAQLNQLVSGALELLGYNLRTAGIKIQSRLKPDLPMLLIDADQIGQIIVNLLVNAQQALLDQLTADSFVAREIRIETGVEDNAVFLRISDNGAGVDEALRERIFDPFFTTKKESTGTGVGLSVSRAIAREHGGELALEHTDSGASFILTLPLNNAAVNESAIKKPAMAEEHYGSALVVDDEMDIAELLADILRSAGYQAHAVSSADEAIAWLNVKPCDFVFCDIRMPDTDGPALWRELQQHYPHLARRTAFITGDTLSASIAPFLKDSDQPCLEKPFLPEDVLALAADLESR